MNGYSRYPREGFLECPECGRWAIRADWRETSRQGVKMCLACFIVDRSEDEP